MTSTALASRYAVKDPSQFYDAWATSYDEDSIGCGYVGPKVISNMAFGFLGKKENSAMVRILDLGAGTGMVGEYLKEEGYSAVDALDASQKMLDIAESRSLYRKYIKCVLDTNNPSVIENSFYDAIICQGCFCTGHLNPEYFPEILRMIKPRGFLLLGLNGNFAKPNKDPEKYYPYDVPGELRQLEKVGKVKVIHCREGWYYANSLKGIYLVVKKL